MPSRIWNSFDDITDFDYNKIILVLQSAFPYFQNHFNHEDDEGEY